MKQDFIYDFAISFAKEDSAIAEEIGNALSSKGFRLFYDSPGKPDIESVGSSPEFGDIFNRDSGFFIVLISKFYAQSSWSDANRQAAITKALIERRANVLPVNIEHVQLSGFYNTLGYLDYKSSSIKEIVSLLLQKQEPHNNVTERCDTTEIIQRVFAICYRKSIFSRIHAQQEWKTIFESVSDCGSELQKLIPLIEPAGLRQLVVSIIAEIDFIENYKEQLLSKEFEPAEFQINGSKLRIIAILLELNSKTGSHFNLPTTLTEDVFYNVEQVNQIPSTQLCTDPWMRIGGLFLYPPV